MSDVKNQDLTPKSPEGTGGEVKVWSYEATADLKTLAEYINRDSPI